MALAVLFLLGLLVLVPLLFLGSFLRPWGDEMAREPSESVSTPDGSAGGVRPVFFHAASTGPWLRSLGGTKRFMMVSASTGSLARRIEAGAEADLFLSANETWMDHLQRRGLLLRGSRRVILGNRLVLVGREAAPGFVDWTSRPAWLRRLAIGDPKSVPVGSYARQALENLGWWEDLQPDLVLSPDATSLIQNLRLGRAPYGILYRSDLGLAKGLRELAPLPDNLHTPIRYSIAVLRSAPSLQAALAALESLASPEALALARGQGFDVPGLEGQGRSASVATASGPPAGEGRTLGPILLSLQVAAAACVLAILPGLFLAWFLARRDFAGKAVLDALLHLPLVIPPVVTGYLLLLVLGPATPLGGFLHDQLGIDLFNWKGAALASAVMGFPLFLRSARLGFENVEPRLEQAASTLGAGPWRVFTRVSFPLALPGVMTGLILCFARSLGEFGATVTFVSLVEGSTDTLPLALWRETQVPGGEGAALRLLLVSVALALLAMLASQWLSERTLGRRKERRA
jgi:molybdate ABC transporter permease protein/molybdenum ABC transporter molybdate-binding protein